MTEKGWEEMASDCQKTIQCFHGSLKSEIQSLSMWKTEFIAIALASQEALDLGVLLRTVTKPKSLRHPTTIYCDNQSSIVLRKNSKPTRRIETI